LSFQGPVRLGFGPRACPSEPAAAATGLDARPGRPWIRRVGRRLRASTRPAPRPLTSVRGSDSRLDGPPDGPIWPMRRCAPAPAC